MADVIAETIIWAQQHGIPTPGFTADGQTTVEATAREIVAAEDAFALQFQKLVQARINGYLTATDFDRYNKAADDLYLAQITFYNEITTGRVYQALNAVGAMRDIPRPQHAPPATSVLGPRPTVAGLGDGGAVSGPLLGLSWGAAILIVVLVVGAVAIGLAALSSAYQAHVNSVQHAMDLDNRMRVYQDCVAAGGDRGDCALTANSVVPPIPPPPDSGGGGWWDSLFGVGSTARLKRGLVFAAAGAALVGVGYLGVKFAAKRIEERPASGMRGLPSGAFSGARYRVHQPHNRSRGRARKGLRGGDYNMEVR